MRRPGSMPLSTLTQYQVRPHNPPARVAERGAFYIRDGWLRQPLTDGHSGRSDVCFLVDFVDGDDERSAEFHLTWTPLREKVVELVTRLASPIGPCRLVSRPYSETLNIWSLIGEEEDGSTFDPMRYFPAPENASPEAPTI